MTAGSYDVRVADELTEVADDVRLDVADRCDRCGAQAKSRVTLRNGILLFCGHHFREHAAAIAATVHVPRSL